MSTTRGANKSRHWVFTDRRKRTEAIQRQSPFPPIPPYLQAIWFQGRTKCEQEKKTLLGGSASVPNFACVATHYPRPGSGVLTRFPFDRLGAPGTTLLKTDFSYLLGSTNPCPIAVHMEQQWGRLLYTPRGAINLKRSHWISSSQYGGLSLPDY